MYADDDLLPISALQHLLFCERQCALIHIEGQWRENRLTAEGRVVHERAHGGGSTSEVGMTMSSSLPLVHRGLGLVGLADIVEFHDDGRVVPVEYKRGRPKRGDMDRVQLCAQALCLEEMLGVSVEVGALYYARPRKREAVPFGAALRAATAEATSRLRRLLTVGVTPPGVQERKCERCSLRDECMPRVTGGGVSAAAWYARALRRALGADEASR